MIVHDIIRAFLASQAPMNNTKEDFWEIVWQVKPIPVGIELSDC